MLSPRELAREPIRKGVLGYDLELWRNPASVHVIRPDDLRLRCPNRPINRMARIFNGIS